MHLCCPPFGIIFFLFQMQETRHNMSHGAGLPTQKCKVDPGIQQSNPCVMIKLIDSLPQRIKFVIQEDKEGVESRPM